MLFPCITFSQTKNKIEGIGIFKIGIRTNKLIDTLQKQTNILCKTVSIGEFVSNRNKQSHTTSLILYIDIPSSSDDAIHKIMAKSIFRDTSVSLIFIDYINIRGVEIHNIQYYFFHDSLYSIQAQGDPELTDAFSIKYGKPAIEKTIKKITCVSKLAGEYNLEEATYFSKWGNSIKNIDAYSIASRYYDDNCDEQLLSTFNIENSKIKDIVRNISIDKPSNKYEIEKF